MKVLYFAVVACLLIVATLRVGALDSNNESCSAADADAPPPRGDRYYRYTATQFINFNINTSGGLASKGECEGLLVDDHTGLCYLGNHDNVEEDLARRLHIIKILLDRIAFDVISDHKFVDPRSDVLKIFMVPEFYFRGPYGAYSTRHMLQDMIFEKHADQLREYISQDAFSDFLFVFGTVVAAEPRNNTEWQPSKQNPLHLLKADDINYYNFAPVYKGGAVTRTSSSSGNSGFVVTKKHIAMDDFLDRSGPGMVPDPAEETFGTYTTMDDRFRSLFKDRSEQIIEHNIIEVDGVRIGVEICLDHREGALWSNLQKRQETSSLVDVQLITSGGMTIERGLNVVAPGGVVYLSDGEASSAACRRSETDTAPIQPDKLCRDSGIQGIKQLAPQGGEGYSLFFPMSHCFDFPKPDLIEGFYSLRQLQGCANTLQTYGMHVLNSEEEDNKNNIRYIPSLEFYPTVALPERKLGHTPADCVSQKK